MASLFEMVEHYQVFLVERAIEPISTWLAQLIAQLF